MDEFNYVKNENDQLMQNNQNFAQRQATLELENKDLEDKIIELGSRCEDLEHENNELQNISVSVDTFKA